MKERREEGNDMMAEHCIEVQRDSSKAALWKVHKRM